MVYVLLSQSLEGGILHACRNCAAISLQCKECMLSARVIVDCAQGDL